MQFPERISGQMGEIMVKMFGAATAIAAFFAGAANAVPVTIDNFGAISGGAERFAGELTAGLVDWYSVEIAADAAYFDIYTSDTEIDLEVGIYSAGGNLVAMNDDAVAFAGDAALSFGTGSGFELGDMMFDGRSGPMLAAGLYYIAVGAFFVNFEEMNFQAESENTTASGFYNLTVKSDVAATPVPSPVPLPASLPLLAIALGGFAGLRQYGTRQ